MAESPNPYEGLSDEELVKVCAGRPVNNEAWIVFDARFHQYIRSRVRYEFTGSRAETDEIVQEAFLKIYNGLPRYMEHRAGLKTFISRIVRNLVIDCFRHGRMSVCGQSLNEEIEDLHLLAAQDPDVLHKAAEHIVDRLGDKSNIPLIRGVLAGKSIETLCIECGLSEHKVKGARRWVHDRLREIADKLPSY